MKGHVLMHAIVAMVMLISLILDNGKISTEACLTVIERSTVSKFVFSFDRPQADLKIHQS